MLSTNNNSPLEPPQPLLIFYNVKTLKIGCLLPKSAVIQYNTGNVFAANAYLIKIFTFTMKSQNTKTFESKIPISNSHSCVCRGLNDDELYLGGDGVFRITISSGKAESISNESCNDLTLDPIRKYLYFVSGLGSTVTRFSLSNRTFEYRKFKIPYSVTVDSLGNLYIADKDYIYVIEFQEGKHFQSLPVKVFLDLSNGNENDENDEDDEDDEIVERVERFPLGLATDIWNDDIYFAEYHKHLIRKVSSNKILTTIAGTTIGKSENGVLSNECKFHNCRSVDLDINGDIYVSDRGNNRICKLITITNNRLKKNENDKFGNLNIIGICY